MNKNVQFKRAFFCISSRICFIIFGYAQNPGQDNSGEEMLKI